MATIAGDGPGELASGGLTSGERATAGSAANEAHGAERQTIELLWTSGWDSTFRLLSALFLEDVTVQPHYIIDRKRPSLPVEQRAMMQIREALSRTLPGADERLLATITAERDDIAPHPETSERFANLAARGPIGTQYEWLARYAIWKGLTALELSVHDDDRANAYLSGKVELVKEEPFATYRLAEHARGGDLELFADFVFPVFDLSKVAMREAAAAHGFLDILELSWFCHHPLAGGVPCGICNPCLDATREGVGYRLPRVSRLRQAVHRVVPWTKIVGKLKDLAKRGT